MNDKGFALYEPPVEEDSEPVFTTEDYQAACDYAAVLSFLMLPGGRDALKEHLRGQGADS